MRKAFKGLFLILLSLVFSIAIGVIAEAACTTPFDDVGITTNTVLCQNTYHLNDTNSNGRVITINASNIVFNCNSSVLIGNTTGRGIFINNFTNVTIQNCNALNYTYGFHLNLTFNNTLINNTARNNSDDGFFIEDSNNNLLISNNAINNTNGFHLDDSDNNALVDSFSNENSKYGIYLETSSTNNNIIDTVASNSVGSDVYSSGKNNTFINSTFDKSKVTVTATADFTVKWYLDVYVNDTAGNNVSSANATMYNVSGERIFSLLTGSNGYTQTQNVTEYDNIGGAIYSYTNYTIIVNKTGYPFSQLINNKSINITSSTTIVFTLDNLGPNISNENRTPETVYNNYNVTLNATIKDVNGVSSAWIASNWNGSWVNYTNSTIIINNVGSNYTFILGNGNLSNQEIIYWRYYANDTLNNIAEGTLQSFTVENRAPNLTSSINNLTWAEDTIYLFNISRNFTDADGNTLTWSVTTAQNITIAINQTTGNVSLTPNANFTGIVYVNFTATDGINTTKSNEVILNVTNVNDAPTVNSTPITSAIESVTYTYTATGNDIDPTNDTANLQYFLKTAPAGMIINSTTGIIMWVPSFNKTGINPIEVAVNDTSGANGTQIFNITVNSSLDLSILNIIVDGVTTSNAANGTVIQNVKPGSSIVLDMQIKNRVASDIEDVVVAANISGMNSYAQTDRFNVPGTSTKQKTLSFSVSEQISVGTYELVINGTGNQTDVSVLRNLQRTVYLSTTKFAHDLIINQTTLTSANLSCIRTTNFNVTIINTGTQPEDDLNLTIRNSNLGLSIDNFIGNIIPNEAITRTYDINVTPETAAGTYTLNTTIIYNNKDNRSYVTNSLIVSNCNIPDLTTSEDTLPASQIDLWSYVNTTEHDASTFGYNITETNSSLIDCSVLANRYINCTMPLANQSGISSLNITINKSSYSTYKIITATAAAVNDQPAINVLIQDVTFNEDSYNNSIDLDDYVNDIDNTDAQLTWTAQATNSNINVNIDSATHIATIAAAANWNGTGNITFIVSDSSGAKDNDTIKLTVNWLDDDTPIITDYYPRDLIPAIAENESQVFNVTVSDPDAIANPDGVSLSINWSVDNLFNKTGAILTFIPEGTNRTVTIMVNATDTNGNSAIQTWTLTVSKKPVTALYGGSITTINETNLTTAANITINSTIGQIYFGDNILDLSSVVDLDSYINITTGIIGIDTNKYPQLNKSAWITMRGLTFTTTPTIYYNGGFSATGTNVCPSDICKNINYDSSTGILTFFVEHFSTYFVTGVAANNAPVANAGADQTVLPDELVTLGGSGSSDPDGDNLTYSWSQTSGPSANLSSATAQNPTFTPSQSGVYIFQLIVNDGIVDSSSDSVTITVSTSKLRITDLDVEVDSDSDKNIEDKEDGYTIKEKAKPGSTVEFSLEISNMFPDDGFDIEDVTATITIEKIDDGDDLEEDSDSVDINADDEEKVTVEFNLPEDAEEDTYDVIIEVEGDDENNTEHRITKELKLEVERETHDVTITDISLSPSTVECTRTALLTVEVTNIGSKDEDEVKIEAKNTALGISEEEKEITVDSDSDKDNKYEATFTLAISDDQEEGTYPINVKSYYDGTKSSDSETINLIVKDCLREGEAPTVVTTITDAATTALPSGLEKIPEEKISFRESEQYLLVLALAAIILTGLVVFVIGALVITSKK